MNIVLTGSLGTIGKPLTRDLVGKGHSVTVISSRSERQTAIEDLGAKAAIGTFQDVDFLAATFHGADIVYLMEAWEGIGSLFDRNMDFVAAFEQIGHTYRKAVERSGVSRIVHLSSIGAHTDEGIGSLRLHHTVETILNQLPATVAIKFIRPVGFYTNLYRYMESIKSSGAIIQSYGGDRKEPWVSPLDIAAAIARAMESPFDGRSVHYVASDEISPNDIAKILGKAIGQPDLVWRVVSEQELLAGMQTAGMNEWIAQGFIGMQASQGTGALYDDYYRHRPTLGTVRFANFAQEFAQTYKRYLQTTANR